MAHRNIDLVIARIEEELPDGRIVSRADVIVVGNHALTKGGLRSPIIVEDGYAVKVGVDGKHGCSYWRT